MVCGKMKILIVEDEIFTSIMLHDYLVSCGHEICQSVSTGEEAVQAAIENRPDFILMDVRLAGHMNGIEAAEAILTEYQVPIVFLTGDSEQLIHLETMKIYPAAILNKPILLGKLGELIESMK
jgi:two-component system, response regulator PdtaR